MKYRIKRKVFKSGREEFSAQVKEGLFWKGLSSKGESFAFIDLEKESRECALACIDEHFKGNGTKQIIVFEYIDKS